MCLGRLSVWCNVVELCVLVGWVVGVMWWSRVYG